MEKQSALTWIESGSDFLFTFKIGLKLIYPFEEGVKYTNSGNLQPIDCNKSRKQISTRMAQMLYHNDHFLNVNIIVADVCY